MSIEDADTFVHGQFVRIQSYARVASVKAQQIENARAAKKGKPPQTIWNSSEVIAGHWTKGHADMSKSPSRLPSW